MDIQRRQKYTGSGRTAVKTDVKINLNFDLSALTLMCSYVVSENRSIRRSHLINMRNLFEIIDLEVYINDIDKLKRVEFIKKGLEGRLLENLDNPIVIIKYINGGIIDDDIIDINTFKDLSTNDIDWINGTVSESLKYAFIYNDVDNLIDVATRFKAQDYRSRGVIVQEMETLIDTIKGKFRKVKAEKNTDRTFSLRPGVFEESIREIHRVITNPSRRIICGMQGLNSLVGGAFEATRVYMFLGLTGIGKSITLVNLAYQFKKYNKNYKPRDPSKIPAIVILTMENSIEETVERLYQMACAGDLLKNTTPSEAISRLRTEGELYLTDESPLDLIIKYIPNKSVDTGYLYTMTEDLEDEGYEVVALLQDHIKRIKSVTKTSEVRFELGEVMNEFKVFAQLKELVVITVSHLNRDGARVVDSADVRNKADLTRLLGRSNIGESMLMLDNADGGYIINADFDSDGNKYMAFKEIKTRVKNTLKYICQPFVTDNGIKLMEDIYSPIPLFKETLAPELSQNSLFNNGITKQNSTNQRNQIKDIGELLKTSNSNKFDDDENIFHRTKYTKDTIYDENKFEEYEPSTFQPIIAGIQSRPIIKSIIEFYN